MPRPIPTWHGFVGQREIVASLAEHARGAVQKAETLPHVLLGGQSGVGKTHLAKAVAADMQTGFHEFCCSRQAKKIDVAEGRAAEGARSPQRGILRPLNPQAPRFAGCRRW